MQLKLILCDHVSNVWHGGNTTGHSGAMMGPSLMTSGDSKCKKGVQEAPRRPRRCATGHPIVADLGPGTRHLTKVYELGSLILPRLPKGRVPMGASLHISIISLKAQPAGNFA